MGITHLYCFGVENSTMTSGDDVGYLSLSLGHSQPDSAGRGNLIAWAMTNDKAQMPNGAQNPNKKKSSYGI
jgi:hypothetical protein